MDLFFKKFGSSDIPLFQSQRRGFLSIVKTVSHKNLLTVNNNEKVFFGSKMGQTKHKPFRMRDFIRFFVRNFGLHLKCIFLKRNARNGILLGKSNNQINQKHNVDVSKNLFRIFRTSYCGTRYCG